MTLAKDLDVLEPKKPEQIFKNQLDAKGPIIDSAKDNLATSYANAFVNAGFGKDYLITGDDGINIYFNCSSKLDFQTQR